MPGSSSLGVQLGHGPSATLQAMAQTTLQKLGIKPGMRVRCEGSAREVARAHLGALPEGATIVDVGSADLILFYAHSLDDVAGHAKRLFNDVVSGGRFWIAYRKGATRRTAAGGTDGEPLHRDSLQRVLLEHGLEGVTLIALDDIWSAMRVKSC